MPKSRKTKAKHKDFNKVKLKVGRKLPRAENETNTAFRSRDIQLREQFHSADESQPTTRRKLNIKELLSQCQHFSASSRRDAVSGLHELLTSYPEVISSNLSLLLERVPELFVDKDSEVRTNVHKLLRILFLRISKENISPFFSLLSAHLCCAMTHIYDDIKTDSLIVLDLCLDHYPALVTADSNRILENFLEQISSKSGSKDKRTLLVDPSNKLTSQKWRLKVLQRIHSLLLALVKSTKVGCESEQYSCPFLIGPCSADIQGYLYKPIPSSVSCSDPLSSFIPILIPLLVECWVEAGPSQMTSTLQGNALNQESMSLLFCVVSILALLLEFISKSSNIHSMKLTDFRTKFAGDVIRHLFIGFPYCMHERPRHSKQKSDITTTISVLTLNISVCQVMSYLWSEGRKKQNSHSQIVSIVNYLASILNDRLASADQVIQIVDVIDQLLKRSIDISILDPILSAALSFFKSHHASSRDVMAIHCLFTKYSLDEFNNSILRSSPHNDAWLSHLPSHFLSLKSVPDKTEKNVELSSRRESCLRTMLKAAAQNSPVFFDALAAKIGKILDVAFFNSLTSDHKDLTLQLLWCLTSIDQSLFKRLSSLYQRKIMSAAHTTSLIHRLAFKYEKSRDEGCQAQFTCEDFISFLLSLCVGCSVKELQSLESDEMDCNPSIVFSENSDCNALISVVKASFLALRMAISSSKIAEIVLNFFAALLKQHTTLKSSSAFGILMMSSLVMEGFEELASIHMHWLSALLVSLLRSAHSKREEFETKPMLQFCLQFLSNNVLASRTFCLICSNMQACSSQDAVDGHLRMLSDLLNQEGSLSILKPHADVLSSIVQLSKDKSSEKIWTSFKYSISILMS